MNDPLTELRFALIALEESRRVVVCRPDLEDRVRAVVADLDVAGTIEVRATPNCPEGKILVMDPNALEANLREVLARPIEWRW